MSPNDRNVDQDDDDENNNPAGKTQQRLRQKPNQKTSLSGSWAPTFTQTNPEWVVLSRAKALAQNSYKYLEGLLSDPDVSTDTTRSMDIFTESSASFKSYSALLRVDPDLVIDSTTSCTTRPAGTKPAGDGTDNKDNRNSSSSLISSFTTSMQQIGMGPKALRRKLYRNLVDDKSVLHNWTPVDETVRLLRERYNTVALFFYNELSPEVIAILWRPNRFVRHPFSAITSEYARPVIDSEWTKDTMVIDNMRDIMREMTQYTKDIVIGVKLIDDRTIRRERPIGKESDNEKRSKKRKQQDSEDDGSEEDSDDESRSDSKNDDDDDEEEEDSSDSDDSS